MAKTTRRRKTVTKDQKMQYFLVACFIALIICAATIYFRAQTGWFGKAIGGAVFRLFGVTTYAVPPLTFLFLVSAVSGNLHGKLLRTLVFLASIFLCVAMIIGVRDLPVATVNTTVSLSAERGEILRGAGITGGLLSLLFRRIIGEIGIWLLFVFVLFFFVLHLFDVKMVEFFTILSEWIRSGWKKTKMTGKAMREKAELRRQEKRVLREQQHKEESISFDADRATKQEEQTTSWQDDSFTSPYIPKPFDADVPSEDVPLSHSRKQENAVPYDGAISDMETPLEKEKEEQVSVSSRKASSTSEKQEQFSMENYGVSMDEDSENTYITPPIELLKSGKKSGAARETDLEQRAKKIESTLASFGIEAHVVSIQRGPTVTQFELQPQAGIKVSRITNLADDLALALAAQDIRIEAPIPGKPYVGIEVPNRVSDTVSLRDLFQCDAFVQEKDGIPIALGKSIDGHPVIAKITKMPHLLIAGATGSGKSVCINTIIMSILYKYSPSEVRLILIDPKVVELSVYNEIPHLMIPVVTDPKKAAKALYTLVKEMERRFKLFSQFSVRDISGYREQQKIDESMENLPYIVLIIDELSDLMMVASKDVEAHITRLAQMARACGIHLIIATQRPSVDVITGTIKANIPSRISFAVSSSIDPRTILDQSGSEKLLGKGDMLYYPSHFPKPKRVQGAFVSDAEVSQVTHFLTDQHDVCYDKELIASLEKTADVVQEDEDAPKDALMEEVLEFISHEETTSISGLQRRFRIGYARAGRIIDDLEAMGAISPQDGSKPREVYIHEQEDDDESAQ